MSNRIELTGKQFGRLKVVEYSHRDKAGNAYWKCICKCGNEKIIQRNSLLLGGTQSCGCLHKELSSKRNKTHGMSKTNFYLTYKSIIERCNKSYNPFYHGYGGRGIKCLWKSFDNFKKDMYGKYCFAKIKYRKIITKKNPITIERKDVNGNYCKENCIWIPLNEQQGNRRNNKLFKAISPEGKEFISKNIREFAREYNLNASCIGRDLREGRKQAKEGRNKGWKFEYV